jgi:hypothetical protein
VAVEISMVPPATFVALGVVEQVVDEPFEQYRVAGDRGPAEGGDRGDAAGGTPLKCVFGERVGEGARLVVTREYQKGLDEALGMGDVAGDGGAVLVDVGGDGPSVDHLAATQAARAVCQLTSGNPIQRTLNCKFLPSLCWPTVADRRGRDLRLSPGGQETFHSTLDCLAARLLPDNSTDKTGQPAQGDGWRPSPNPTAGCIRM